MSGNASLLVMEGVDDQIHQHQLGPGDFAFVPAWTEHRLQNDGDTNAHWVIIQSGPRPVGAELEEWAGAEISS
jgi:mannose-6-phosphate isomerase-like protein (cupin superfamily)